MTEMIAKYVTIKFDREAFSRELMGSILCSSEDVWNEMSVDDLSEAYSSVLTSLVDRLAPRIVVRKHFRPITPWFQCRLSSRETQVALFRTSLPTHRASSGPFQLDQPAAIISNGLPAGAARILADSHHEQLRKRQKAVELAVIGDG